MQIVLVPWQQTQQGASKPFHDETSWFASHLFVSSHDPQMMTCHLFVAVGWLKRRIVWACRGGLEATLKLLMTAAEAAESSTGVAMGHPAVTCVSPEIASHQSD